MPRTITSDFEAEKNKETNKPIWLYRIETTDDRVNDLFLAEYDEDVDFYKDDSTPQTYTAFDITHQSISQSRDSEIAELVITVSNVNRSIQSYLEYHDGLRGKKVTIRQVWYDHLDDPYTYIEDEYWIDYPQVKDGGRTIDFHLTGKLDILQIRLPRRLYSRNHCPWIYKGRGCWKEGTGSVDYEEPDGFDADPSGGDECDKTLTDCRRHHNSTRFGGFPSVPARRLVVI